MSDLILYATHDGQSRIQLRAESEAVWLTKQNISPHIKYIFGDNALP